MYAGYCKHMHRVERIYLIARTIQLLFACKHAECFHYADRREEALGLLRADTMQKMLIAKRIIKAKRTQFSIEQRKVFMLRFSAKKVFEINQSRRRPPRAVCEGHH